MVSVTFVAAWAFESGGVPRTVAAVAGELARRGHEVDVVSVYRTRATPRVDMDPLVRVRWLEDLVTAGGKRPRARRDPDRPLAERQADRRPSELASTTHPAFSALIDQRLEELFTTLDTDVVVVTRPELAVAATRWAPARVAVVAAEHHIFEARPVELRDALARCADSLDALVLLTESDHCAWTDRLGPHTTCPTRVIPNAPGFAPGRPASLEAPVIVAAGRLTMQKGFHRLIDAFAPVAAAHPQWRLHIYGEGRQQERLTAQIDRLGLTGRAVLCGYTAQLEQELAAASIFALSSEHEGFSMVLLEAMSVGVPPVSIDCPGGPRELITHGVDGLLVPADDVSALSSALLQLIEDPDRRRRLGRAALRRAAGFTLPKVVDRWEALLGELTPPDAVADRASRPRPRPRPRQSPP